MKVQSVAGAPLRLVVSKDQRRLGCDRVGKMAALQGAGGKMIPSGVKQVQRPRDRNTPHMLERQT